MRQPYINHDKPLTIPQFHKLSVANKAIQELYCALMAADSAMADMQKQKEIVKALPYFGGVLSTQRVNMAKVANWLNFIAPEKI